MGSYENAFRMMRNCYAELGRDPRHCRIADWQDAFFPAPFIGLTERGVTDANGGTTTYAYDSMNRLISATDPLGATEHHSYDTNGRLAQFTDRRGKLTVFQYDAQNRKTFAGSATTEAATQARSVTSTTTAII